MPASALAAALGISVPTVHRLLHEHGSAIVAAGRARRARYALRRPVRGDSSELPLYRVGADGKASEVSRLALIEPQGSRLDLGGSGWPLPAESRDGWWPGLPYPLYDMRPQGYMGRQLARAVHRRLDVSPDPEAWGDLDIAFVLSRIGADVTGDLILGDAAFEHWQSAKLAPPVPVKTRAVAAAYARLAEEALAAGVPGSSAAGEFPKFLALREHAGGDTAHVLVKFSGADASPAVRRWSDLLVCEHLALESAAALPGIESAASRIVAHAGRTFLEVERFDRHGLLGRSALIGLQTLDAALLGDGSTDWTQLADRLHATGLLDAGEVRRVEHIWWFGRLIANTDMHTANLSFRLRGGGLEVAPVYDMQPMAYAPLPGGEVVTRRFEPPLPLPARRDAWEAACAAAATFWTRASADSRITARFRRVCRANAVRLSEVAASV